ncbi:thiol reductant ABC exporter subunit CydC [Williamsia deligens]|uniref:Thiol reductant ABC exporter subunit CydC n=1 Tax=Williamsia deligens TaxID=321325 RepID=A0ABW3G6J1_9NOCA|nr:thiol reductant ABC exporter subunit CydC [Williamsia deligens]MCP2192907.1 ATP-binding cassette, subfamily C, CydC [Williamsia deligens]
MPDDPLVRAARLVGLSRRRLARSVGLGAAAALSALALAALSAWLITRAWQMPPVLSVAIAVTSVRALGISRALFRYLERLSTHDLALRVMASARSRIYAAVAGGAPDAAVRVRPSDLVARTGRDVDELGESLVRAAIPIGAAAITAVAAVAIVGVISPWAGVAVAVVWVLAGIVGPAVAVRGAAHAERAAAGARDRSTDLTMTLLWHAAEVEVAGRRRELLAAAADQEQAARRATDAGARLRSWSAGVLPAAAGACLVVACLLATGLADSLDPTAIGVLILVPLSAFEAATPLLEAGRQLHRSRRAATRILAVVDDVTATDPVADVRPVRSATPRIEVCADMTWGHAGRATAGPLRTGLVVDPGSRIAVVGPSGSGKTTLLATIAGLLAPVAGAVRVLDDSGAPVDPGDAIRWFASDAHVFATTIRENLLVARGDAPDADLLDVLDRVGLAGWVAELQGGLDHVLQSGADALSTGQRRRLLLARALLCPVPVLLLDEPCENVEPDEADALVAALLDPAGGLVEPERTVVVVTHRLPRGCTPSAVVDLRSPSAPRIATEPISRSAKSDCRVHDSRVTSVVHEEGGGLELHYSWTREVTIS